MFSEVSHRLKKVGQLPGTPIYTGEKKNTITRFSIVLYDKDQAHVINAEKFSTVLKELKSAQVTWMNIEGLGNLKEIEEVGEFYKIHPLTLEDILNVEQRPKVELFDNYLFLTLRALNFNKHHQVFSTEQLSFIINESSILTFQEFDTTRFAGIKKRLESSPKRLKQHSADYLLYRFVDEIVDEYFVVLNTLGEEMERVERKIVANPTPQNARHIYRLKRQLLILRKAIWPMREVVNHLLHDENDFIKSNMRIYLRDLYDHIVQAIDTLETFRDMLSSMLDMYFSSLTNRMNEIMKTLTIISTIFIPITAIASIYGMNFYNLPGINWRFGYPLIFILMIFIAGCMLIYFRRKKWL